jgi:hypothetical protein
MGSFVATYEFSQIRPAQSGYSHFCLLVYGLKSIFFTLKLKRASNLLKKPHCSLKKASLFFETGTRIKFAKISIIRFFD